ncbi:hypothetical protein BaRGS_00027758, partial [Batillaria attramentaria]
ASSRFKIVTSKKQRTQDIQEFMHSRDFKSENKRPKTLCENHRERVHSQTLPLIRADDLRAGPSLVVFLAEIVGKVGSGKSALAVVRLNAFQNDV